MCVIKVYDDKREEIITYVSTCGLQEQSDKDKSSSKEVTRSLRLNIEHMNSLHKTILTRTFLPRPMLEVMVVVRHHK